MKKVRQVIFALTAVSILTCSGRAETIAMPVPSRSIFPGQIIQNEDFIQRDFEVSPVAKANFVVSLDQLQHKEAAKILSIGKPIPTSALKNANDVRKGQEVRAIFVADGIEIQGILAPLRDGMAGQIVPCRNPSSGITVDATVLADGSLSVTEK